MIPLTPENLDKLTRWFLEAEIPAPIPNVDKTQVAHWCFSQLFLQAPPLVLDEAKVAAFEQLIQTSFHHIPAQEVIYDCPYPKSEFLRYLVERKDFLLHGTKDRHIEQLEPQSGYDFDGTEMTAVFATRDGVWPLFFALVDRQAVSGIRNACMVVEQPNQKPARFYFFAIQDPTQWPMWWSPRMIYVLPSQTFKPTGIGPVRFDEWASEKTVPVVTKLSVEAEDFPFLHQVTRCEADEPVMTTWLRFKEKPPQPPR